MNWIPLFMRNIAEVIDGFANNIHYAAQGAFADRHSDRTAGVGRLHPTHHAVGR